MVDTNDSGCGAGSGGQRFKASCDEPWRRQLSIADRQQAALDLFTELVESATDKAGIFDAPSISSFERYDGERVLLCDIGCGEFCGNDGEVAAMELASVLELFTSKLLGGIAKRRKQVLETSIQYRLF